MLRREWLLMFCCLWQELNVQEDISGVLDSNQWIPYFSEEEKKREFHLFWPVTFVFLRHLLIYTGQRGAPKDVSFYVNLTKTLGQLCWALKRYPVVNMVIRLC